MRNDGVVYKHFNREKNDTDKIVESLRVRNTTEVISGGRGDYQTTPAFILALGSVYPHEITSAPRSKTIAEFTMTCERVR